MPRAPALLLSVLLLGSVLAPVAAQSAAVAITDVATTPTRPNPGERFVVETTVANGQSATGAFEVTDVYVRRAGSAQEFARVEDVGAVEPGASLTVPLPMRLDRAGSYDLRVSVVGTSNGSTKRPSYPLLVTVRETGPQLSVDADAAVVGSETTAHVTVVNGAESAITNLRLDVGGRHPDAPQATRVAAPLDSGGDRTFDVRVTPRATDATVRANLSYVSAEGAARTVSTALALSPDPLRDDVGLEARIAGDGADPPLAVTVANFGNAPLTDLTVAAIDGGTVVARRPVDDVAPGARREVRLNLSGVGTGPLQVRATYETAGEAGSAATDVGYRSNPGHLELTGVDVEPEDGALHVSGSVSNVGLGQVDSVVVRVLATDGVAPTRPYPDYFVGTVPASNFASFDLSADVDPGVESVPVRVEYLVDGDRRSTVQQVPVGDVSVPAPASGGPSLVPLALGALAVVVLLGGAVYYYRRR